ncbi:dimethylamine monooxygenase subunit DmmA family protein [Prauserella oleivorans]
MPRWSTSVPSADLSGRSYAVMTFSDACLPAARRWLRELTGRPVWTWHGARAGDDALAALREQIAEASVGWRLLLAGPEPDVLTVRSEAVRAGVLDAEITVSVSASGRRRVWCAHCGHDTEATADIGALIDCAGCGRSLLVYHHVARRHAAYLGFQADAEEVP